MGATEQKPASSVDRDTIFEPSAVRPYIGTPLSHKTISPPPAQGLINVFPPGALMNPTEPAAVTEMNRDEDNGEYALWDQEKPVKLCCLKGAFIDLIQNSDNVALAEALYNAYPQWTNFAVQPTKPALGTPDEKLPTSVEFARKGNERDARLIRLVELIWAQQMRLEHTVLLEPALHDGLQQLLRQNGVDGLYA